MHGRQEKGGGLYKEEVAYATCPETEKKCRKGTERWSCDQSRGAPGGGTSICKVPEEMVKI